MPNLHARRLRQLKRAAKCGLADLINLAERGDVEDRLHRDIIALYEALADLDVDVEGFTLDVQLSRDWLEDFKQEQSQAITDGDGLDDDEVDPSEMF